MKKRTNPKIEAMRERSLMVESERQEYERNYSLNEQRSSYNINHNEDGLTPPSVIYKEIKDSIEGPGTYEDDLGDAIEKIRNQETYDGVKALFNNDGYDRIMDYVLTDLGTFGNDPMLIDYLSGRLKQFNPNEGKEQKSNRDAEAKRKR